MLFLLLPTLASAQSPINQWQRWETTITAARNYTTGSGQTQGNPYRDLILRVRFTHGTSGDYFIQDAFWTGNTGANTQFKARAMLYPGTWTWRVENCSGTTGGFNCATDANLTTANTGSITVNSYISSGKKIYDRGAVTQLTSVTGGGAVTYSQLLYDDLSNFFWGGDTAWVAPPREIYNTPSLANWIAYLDNRKAKGFTVVLVAPAPAWGAGPDWPALPAPIGFSFDEVSGCTDPRPNNCTRPRAAYWDKFDEMVKAANDRDLVVGIVGVIDPIGLGSNNNFPNKPYVEDFARYLAARMAGSHVVFSPGFDLWVTDKTKDGTTLQTVMNGVGNALKAAAPRHLVSNHLAGQSPCTDYQLFQNSGWMTFHLYQSGHAAGANGVPGTVCPGRISPETPLQAALRRAREMPLTLRDYTNAKMPNVNGEALYDGYPTATEPNTRYRARQSGYYSMLSGSIGFTYGTNRLWQWHQVGNTVYNLGSAVDMQRLIARFKDRSIPFPRHDLILNQSAANESKMVLASNNYSLLVAYLPGAAPSIRISTTSFGNLTCANGLWSKTWYEPTTNAINTQAISCTQGSGWIQLNRPTSGGNADNDWVLELFNGSISTMTAPSAAGPQTALVARTDLSADDGTSAIVAELAGTSGGEPVVVSAAGEAFQSQPQSARLGDGHLVVWQADGLDGSLLGVFAQRFDAAGRPLGDRFQVNEGSEGDQRDPVVAADALGNALVVWSSHGPEGSAVVARRFDRSGWPLGGEFTVGAAAAGRLERPLVGFAPDGGFAVAWSAGGAVGAAPAVVYRRFDAAARPDGDEVRVAGRRGEQMHATGVEAAAGGFVTLRWLGEDGRGGTRAKVKRFDDRGREAAPPLRLDVR